MLIPVSNYRFERIQPMNHMRDVERHLDALHKLSELAFVSKVLLGAQYRSKGEVLALAVKGVVGTHQTMGQSS